MGEDEPAACFTRFANAWMEISSSLPMLTMLPTAAGLPKRRSKASMQSSM
jgi:hypothetical protein